MLVVFILNNTFYDLEWKLNPKINNKCGYLGLELNGLTETECKAECDSKRMCIFATNEKGNCQLYKGLLLSEKGKPCHEPERLTYSKPGKHSIERK